MRTLNAVQLAARAWVLQIVKTILSAPLVAKTGLLLILFVVVILWLLHTPTPAHAQDPFPLSRFNTWISETLDHTYSVAWGDVDGDGDLDLATGNNGENKVYLNQNGVLQTTAAWTSGDSDYTWSVAWGDMDGDGDLDLAAGNYGENKVYLNQNGVLQTPAAWISGDGDDTNSVAWGDVDGDGDLDLAAGNVGDNKVYLNQNGVLQTAADSTVWTSGDSDDTYSVAWGDVDGDGDLDLAAGNVGDNKVYLNQNGVLQTTAAWTSDDSELTNSVAWGDVDGDGDLDLAAGNLIAPNKVYLNQNGVLQTAADPTVWTSGDSDLTYSMAWGDVDGDGDLDLAAGNTGDNKVYLNQNGVLQTAVDNPWTSGDSDWTYSVAWGDVDGDGDLDLAAGNSLTPNKVYLNQIGVLQTTAAWTSGDNDDTNSVAWGDVDGDGDLDLAVGNNGANKVYLNQNGVLQTAADNPWISGDGDDTNSVAWGDVDGDGDLDLAAGNSGEVNKVYLNQNGVLQTAAAWTSVYSDATRSVAWGDVDGDGDLDLAVGNYSSDNEVYLNQNGVLQTAADGPWTSGDSDFTGSVAWGDVDGDGDLDLAVGNWPANKVYLNQNGVLQTPAAWISGDGDGTRSVAWGDVEGDGDLDLAAGNNGANKVYLNQNGVLQTAADNPWTSGDSDSTSSVAWGDVDGDGDLDLAVGNSGANKVYLNGRPGRSLPNNAPCLTVRRPITPAVTSFYVPPPVITSITIPLTYTLFDPEGDPVGRVAGFYSFNGGGQWFSAVATTDTITTNPSTGRGFNRAVLTPTQTIPDTGVPLNASLVITDSSADIAEVEVWLTISHTNNADLAAAVQSPAGTQVPLFSTNSLSDSNLLGTVFDDQAATPIISGTAPYTGTYRPEGNLAAFKGQSSSGTWTLVVTNTGASGTLAAWGLRLKTSPVAHVYNWDTFSSGFFGQSDNVVIRLVAYPQAASPVISGTYRYTDTVASPYQRPYASATTFPFRVRGTQVRVLSGTVPISNALVYRLPAGQSSGGLPLGGDSPFVTDHNGYLQGRGQIGLGDQLLALAPVPLPPEYTERYSDTLHLYYTNGTPTELGLDTLISSTHSLTVTQPGVQVLQVSAERPLLLFDLDVSLEWDASHDPTYLSQLEFDLKRASRHLYDFTDGQVALGQVTVYQNADNWAFAHVDVHATNRMRPFATIGGMVLTDTIDPGGLPITYTIGQVNMGSTWNRYGNPGQSLGEDWPLILAHELSHFLFSLEDVYLGLNEDDLLIAVDSCTGSAMGDTYAVDNTEFVFDGIHWTDHCTQTLADKTLGRDEWETIELWYPWLISPISVTNPGPSVMPFELITVEIRDPMTPTSALQDPTFYLDYAGGEVSSSGARAFLLRDGDTNPDDFEYVYDLGSPVGGQNRLLARGAQPGDRLCVLDQARRQYGCEIIQLGDERLALEKDENWTPVIQISPVHSTTFTIQVSGLPVLANPLKAQLYPEFGIGFTETVLALAGNGAYTGTLELDYPALVGDVQVWVEETAEEFNPRRETIVPYSIGGNPGTDRGGGGTDRGGGGTDRGGGGTDRGGGGTDRGGGAPAVSPDGQMIFFTANPIPLDEGQFYTVQDMAGLPPLPQDKTAIGQGYNLFATPGTPVMTGSISFQYLGNDVLVEGMSEDELAIHFWNGTHWQTLDTYRDTYYNLASTPSQGAGVYALLAGVTTPLITDVIPSEATNDKAITLTISGSHFLPPVEVALEGPTASYTLPLTSVSPYTITALVPQGLQAREYEVWVVNQNQPGGAAVSPTPGTFALYDLADACFYDFFESGAGKWERSGDWEIGILPDGERAMTDSPAGNYRSAISPTLTYTTSITSQAFSLDDCANPLLTLRHDYVIDNREPSQDVGRVELSTDAGVTWTELASYSGGIPGLGAQDVAAPEWVEVDWKEVEIDLSVYTGTVRLRFSLEVDQVGADKGWVIDDVVVKSGPGPAPPAAPLYLPIIMKEE
jgi:subtilisin-like proprotein convertase family protein